MKPKEPESDCNQVKRRLCEFLKKREEELSSTHENLQLCAQLRVCSQAGGIPVYPRFSQPDNSESWDDAGNGI